MPFRSFACGHKRIERLQQDEDTALKTADVINLDDTVIDHPFGKSLPFLCWLYDSSQKISVWDPRDSTHAGRTIGKSCSITLQLFLINSINF